jgi:hypothetical protein
MREPAKPRRVVIVDADNPLQEIRGEFFWREDHERLLAAARTEAFQLGYSEALRDSARAPNGRVVVRVRGRRSAWRVGVLAVAVLVAAAYLVELFTA